MKSAISLLPGCVLILLLSFFDATAQSGWPNMSFGAVLPEAFAPAVYALDSSANAVYLFDHGEVSFDARYSNYGFSIVYERHARIRILNKNGLGLATMGISAVHHKGYDANIDDVLRLPAGWSPEGNLPAGNYSCALGCYHIRSRFEDGTLTLTCSFSQNKGIYPAQDYAHLVRLFDLVHRESDRELAFVKPAPKAGP
jgi:hypothetical protein